MANQSSLPRSLNPFQARTGRGLENTLKYAAWEVLSEFPQGLHISLVAKEVQERGLRDLSGKKNATGLISGELVRAKEVFCQTGAKTWKLRAFDTSGDSGNAAAEQRRAQPKGDELVGHRVAVWWRGERKYFDGVIDRYDFVTKEYSVVYDDGDTDDNLKLYKYTVTCREGKIDLVTVNEHNLDDATDTTTEDTKASKDASEWSSLGQFSGSLDSLTAGEFSESGQKGNRDTGTSRRRSRQKTTNKRANRSRGLQKAANIAVTVQDGQCSAANGDKSTAKRCHSWDDDKLSKKTKIGPLSLSSIPLRLDALSTRATGSVMPSFGHSSTVRSDHVCPEEKQSFNRQNRNASSQMQMGMVNNDINHVKNGIDLADAQYNAAGQSRETKRAMRPPAIPTPGPKTEKIDVLDLKRQLQPPEDSRPNLKNLEDVGPLMTLDELSDELRGMKESEADQQEVLSRYHDSRSPDVIFFDESRMKIEETSKLQRSPPPLSMSEQTCSPIEQMQGCKLRGVMPPVCHRGIGNARQQIRGKLDPSTEQSFSCFARFAASPAAVSRRHELLSPSILSARPVIVKPEDIAPSLVGGTIQPTHPIVSMANISHSSMTHKRPLDRPCIGDGPGRMDDKHIPVGPAVTDKSSLMSSIALDHIPSRQRTLLSPETEAGSQSTQSSRTSMKRQWEGGYSIAGV